MWLLAVLLIVAQITLIAWWSWSRSPRAGRAVWIGFGAIPILLILSGLVRTPRERIVATVVELAQCVETEDLYGIENWLAPEFEAEPYDRAEFLAQMEAAFDRASIRSPTVHGFEISFPRSGVGVAVFQSGCRIETNEASIGWLPLRWRLTFERRGDRWLVEKIETMPVPPLHVHSLTALLQRRP